MRKVDERSQVPPPPNSFAVLISPFALGVPMAELTGVWHSRAGFALAAIAGYGVVAADGPDGKLRRLPGWEVGGQALLDLLPFDPDSFFDAAWLQLGVEVTYARIVADSDVPFGPNALLWNTSLVPLIGWELQIGPLQVVVHHGLHLQVNGARPPNGGATADTGFRLVGYRPNVKIGFSF